MNENVLVQKIKRVESRFFMAYKYYGVISVINGIDLTNKELQLIAYIGINGNISSIRNKENFCKEFNSSIATVNNMISRLKKYSMLIKKDGRVVIHPAISLDFNKEIILNISLNNK